MRRVKRLWREWKMVQAAPLVILVGPESVISNSELRGLQIKVGREGEVSHLGFIMHDHYPDQALLQGERK